MNKIILILLFIIFICIVVSYCVAKCLFEKYFTRNKERWDNGASFYKVLERGPYANMIKKMKKAQAWFEDTENEDVYIKSRDGLRLHAVLYENLNGNGVTAVLSHGYRSDAAFDFCLGAKLYYSLGYNILLVDHRAHAASEGEYITFGAKERYDIVDWCNYLLIRYGEKHKFILSGMSMGSTAVILAACLEEMSDNLVCVIADCGFSTVYDEVAHVMKGLRIPKFPIILFADLIFRRRTGAGFKDFDTAVELRKAQVPFLFFHGEEDTFVLCENTLRNYEACASPKTMITVPGAGHGMSYIADENTYREEVIGFLNSCFADR